MPFMAEEIYQELKFQSLEVSKFLESVHLEEWPKFNKRPTTNDKQLLNRMQEARKICSLGLEARQKAGIKVRQPLQSLKVKSKKLKGNNEFLELIKDEVNVKEIIFDKNINPPVGGEVELDIKITPELKAEGQLRDLVRIIQDLRKKAGLVPQQKIELIIETDGVGEKLIKQFEAEIKRATNAIVIEFSLARRSLDEGGKNDGEKIKIDEPAFKIKIKK